MPPTEKRELTPEEMQDVLTAITDLTFAFHEFAAKMRALGQDVFAKVKDAFDSIPDCIRCHHHAWEHRHDDVNDNHLATDRDCPFRCVHEGCECPDYLTHEDLPSPFFALLRPCLPVCEEELA